MSNGKILNIEKPDALSELNKIVSSDRNIFEPELILRVSKFPKTWDDYENLAAHWRLIIANVSKWQSIPALQFLVGIYVEVGIYEQKPPRFNWSKYENPELILDCSDITGWRSVYIKAENRKINRYLNIVMEKNIYEKNYELQDAFPDIYEFTQDEPYYLNYYLPLGQIIQMNFRI